MFPRNQRGRFLPRKDGIVQEVVPIELPSTPALTPLSVLETPNNNKKNNTPSPLLDVRNEEQIPELRQLILNGPTIYVLIHADWCGHCHRYMPKFKEIAKTPGRVANMAAVHHDMVEKVPELKNAKITGYPSVVKVEPTGKVEDYKVPGTPETTNVVPQMNDPKVMKALVKAVETAQPNAKIPGPQGVLLSNTDFLKKNAEVTKNSPQAGGAYGSVLSTFVNALNKAGPAALLLLGSTLLPKQKRGKTYKSPKKANRRASTRRNRH
jgi:thiol-disulfide isomerase/thioredoxin